MNDVSVTISEANKFSDQVFIKGHFNLSVFGTFIAEVVLQRKFSSTSWLDVATYLSPIEDTGYEPEGAVYRVGVKTGKFTSGTVEARIGNE